jgi:hypothetical protein
MATDTRALLHDVHTATNDVLTGYREMASRAEPEIQGDIQRLITLHDRHAGEQKAALARLGATGGGDTSVQGTVNKMVVVLRDWLSSLDRDVLPAVRDGEKALRDEYRKALEDGALRNEPQVRAMLGAQLAAIDGEIARLPKD